MKICFREHNFRAGALRIIDVCNSIIDEYLAQGLRLTLRQLYYQLVSRNVMPNIERSYSKLSGIISDGRLAGLIDWEAIEDRIRVPKAPPEFKNLKDLVEAAVASYRLPRWENQKYYVELWVEKDALAGVLAPIARKNHVTLMVNRGYSSQSAMYEAAVRFDSTEKFPILFYLGDHDPSGEDMDRDIKDRLEMFGMYVTVAKIALTIEQVREYDPPPNPAKITDPRAREYIDRYGEYSWEVDALPPNILAKIVQDEFDSVIDRKTMQEVIDQEVVDKRKLRKVVVI